MYYRVTMTPDEPPRRMGQEDPHPMVLLLSRHKGTARRCYDENLKSLDVNCKLTLHSPGGELNAGAVISKE